MAFTKDRTAAIKTQCDAYDAQWDVVEQENATMAECEANLTTANQNLEDAAREHSPESDEYKAAAQAQAEAQAARDQQYQVASSARVTLDNIQVDMIKKSQTLQA